MNIATAFTMNGLRLGYPGVSLIVEPWGITIVSPLTRSITEYQRRTRASDVLIMSNQIRSIRQWGLLWWGADVELDNGATFGLWSPKLPRALGTLELPTEAWLRDPPRWRSRSTQGAAPIIDARAR